MPLIKLQTSVTCSIEKKEEITLGLSSICAKEIGKPEACVASLLEDSATTSFGGTICPIAFLEVKSIGGLNSDVNGRLSKAICEYLKDKLEIPPSHIYINFIDIPAANWGCNGSTFA